MAKRGRPQKNKNHFKNFITKYWIFALILLAGIFIGFGIGFAKWGVNRKPVVYHPPVKKVAITPLPLPTGTVKIPVLMYHYVETVQDPKDTIRKSLNIPPFIFEKQLKTLITAHYNFITMREVGEYLDGKRELPSKPVVLTFDDGYGDFYSDVYPILKKYNVPATEYVISGVLDKRNYMTTDEVVDIKKSGLVEIGAHTVHHPALGKMDSEAAFREIEGSKKMLESLVGGEVVSFAYPYGSYNDESPKLAEQAGFTTAVTTKKGLEVNQKNRYLLFRIRPGYSTGDGLIKELQ